MKKTILLAVLLCVLGVCPALATGPAHLTNPVRTDGEYSVSVTLTGGSGKASVTSPTLLTVREGVPYARIQWSSSNYDYMLVGGQRYENESEAGANSTFTLPVTAWDQPMEVIADTLAMGHPVEITYQLTFQTDSIGSKAQLPQEAAKRVLAVAFTIIVVGGVLNHAVKKRYR